MNKLRIAGMLATLAILGGGTMAFASSPSSCYTVGSSGYYCAISESGTFTQAYNGSMNNAIVSSTLLSNAATWLAANLVNLIILGLVLYIVFRYIVPTLFK